MDWVRHQPSLFAAWYHACGTGLSGGGVGEEEGGGDGKFVSCSFNLPISLLIR